MRWARAMLAPVLGLLLAAAGQGGGDDAPPPERLSAWQLFARQGEVLRARPGAVTFEPASSLFTDYALKWRVLFVPAGGKAAYDPDGAFDFPVGTVVAKTFYYPRGASAEGVALAGPADYQSGVQGLRLPGLRLIETRLLVRRATGWQALPYVWDADQRDAHLARTGDAIDLTLEAPGGSRPFTYVVPNANDCAGCHAADYRPGGLNRLAPIGLKARHLNHDFAGAGNQLAQLARLGLLAGLPRAGTIPANVDWRDAAQPLEARARSYLDINCSHCHSPVGAARTTGLWFDQGHEHGPEWDNPRRIGRCKQIVAGGHGGGGLPYDLAPGEPDRSIIAYRLASTEPGAMMPELGRSLVHAEGLALIRQWIAAQPGRCGA